jgi:hypothetical protein
MGIRESSEECVSHVSELTAVSPIRISRALFIVARGVRPGLAFASIYEGVSSTWHHGGTETRIKVERTRLGGVGY